jgi:hypothetical protein
MFVENMFGFFFQGRREEMNKGIHSETPTDTSTVHEQLSQMGEA